MGYAAGYERRAFNSSIPSTLARRGTTDSGATTPDNNTTSNSSVDNSVNVQTQSSGQPLLIRRDQVLLIELQAPLSTEASQQGDPFRARVIDPRELEGSIVEGRVIPNVDELFDAPTHP